MIDNKSQSVRSESAVSCGTQELSRCEGSLPSQSSMAWDDGGSRSRIVDLSPTFGVTLTRDTGQSVVQPVASTSTTLTVARPATLFDVWIRACHESEGERRETLLTIIDHEDFRQIFTKAIGAKERELQDSALRHPRDSTKSQFAESNRDHTGVLSLARRVGLLLRCGNGIIQHS